MGLLEEYNALKKKRNPQANTSEKSAGSNTTTEKTDVVSEYNKLKKEREQGIVTPAVQKKLNDFNS